MDTTSSADPPAGTQPNPKGANGHTQVRRTATRKTTKKRAAAQKRAATAKTPAARTAVRTQAAAQPAIGKVTTQPPALLMSLLQTLPPAGSNLTPEKAKTFLKAVEANLGVIYELPPMKAAA